MSRIYTENVQFTVGEEKKPSQLRFLLYLFCLTFSLAGVQFVYSIQFAVGTPLFGEELKVSSSMVAIILSTAGPISGFIVQPIVGVVSDKSTNRFGRRRPFILGGVIVCAMGMAVLGNSTLIGNALGDKPHGETVTDHKIALIFAILGLWVMNVCVNVIQGPARAIVADLVSEDQQQTGNAMVSLVMGLAAIVANIVGAQFLLSASPYRWLFVIGVGFMILSALPTILVAKEQPYERQEGETTMNLLGIFGQIWKGFRHMPVPMLKILLVFFFSWAGFSPFMIYITAFFAQNVYHGNTTDKLDEYHRGVKMGMYALATFAAVQLVYSLLMPFIIKAIKIKPTYFISQIIAAGCFISFYFLDGNLIPVFVLTSVVAINFTSFNSIPFGLVTSSADKRDAGLYMGVLNSASVVAQTITNTAAGQIVGWRHQNVSVGIAFGGALAFLGALLIWTLPNPRVEDKEERAGLLKDTDYD